MGNIGRRFDEDLVFQHGHWADARARTDANVLAEPAGRAQPGTGRHARMQARPYPRLNFVYANPIRRRRARQQCLQRSEPIGVTLEQGLPRQARQMVHHRCGQPTGGARLMIFGEGLGERQLADFRKYFDAEPVTRAVADERAHELRPVCGQNEHLLGVPARKIFEPIFDQAFSEKRHVHQGNRLRQRTDRWPFSRTNEQRFHLSTRPFPTAPPAPFGSEFLRPPKSSGSRCTAHRASPGRKSRSRCARRFARCRSGQA